jgi:hypothetical protein
MGLFSRRSSTTNTSSTQNFYDQRSVNDAGGGIIGDRNSVDGSTNYLDASITTINATDPGALRLGELNAEFLGAAAELNAEFLGAAAESQSDAVRALAQWGKEGFAQMGESVTDLYALAGSNTAKAWSHTLDSSEKLLGRALDSAGRTTDAAKVVAQSAIASYQPAEKSQADALRMGLLIGGGVLLAVLIFRKA